MNAPVQPEGVELAPTLRDMLRNSVGNALSMFDSMFGMGASVFRAGERAAHGLEHGGTMFDQHMAISLELSTLRGQKRLKLEGDLLMAELDKIEQVVKEKQKTKG